MDVQFYGGIVGLKACEKESCLEYWHCYICQI